MKKILFFILIAFSIKYSIAQTTNTIVIDPNAELRVVEDFSNIDVAGNLITYISQGTKHAVAVSCSNEKYTPNIITKVENGTLKVRVEKPTFKLGKFNLKFRVYITVKQLNNLDISGACIVKTVDPINTNEFKMDISGASIFNGEIKTTLFKSDITGASVVNIKGNTITANNHVSGASVLESFNFISENCKLHVSGASVVKIKAIKDLYVKASGASMVKYKGNPPATQLEATGSSMIKPEQ
jgi:hypothetical protein